MMKNNYKHCVVVDENGYYVEWVRITIQPNGQEQIDGYTLGIGEHPIDALPPTDMVKAHWTGTKWEETATAEEIAAAEAERAAMSP